MPSPNPPSELPAVQAEVVEEKRPPIPPCPEMWIQQYWREDRWNAMAPFYRRKDLPDMSNMPTRLIRIPGEGESPSAPTHAGEMPKPTGMTREVEELVAMCEKMADDPLRMVDQISLREKIAAVRAAGGGA